eukprot:PhM_4_TR6767/c0_g1_i1/m.31778
MQRSVIRCPLDWSVIAPFDKKHVMSRFTARHHAVINYTVDPRYIEKYFHSRFTSEAFTDTNGAEHAFVSVVISHTEVPKQHMGFVQRMIDPGPFPCVSYRALIQDKVVWKRTTWQFGTFLDSLYYSRIPRTVYGLPLFNAPVSIDTVFDDRRVAYSKFHVHSPGEKGIGAIDISLEDLGVGLLDGNAPVLDGFDNNESAFAALGIPAEYVTRGEGNWVYRQASQCTPFCPNLANVVGTPQIPYLTESLGLPIDTATPHSAWVQDEVHDLQSLMIEAHVEDDNEPNSGSNMAGASGPSGGIHDRIQRKAMNRAERMKSDIRQKVYADNEGKGEFPRGE